MKLADGCTLAEVCSHFTVDEAVKALRPAPTPAPAIEEHPVEHPVEEHVVEEEHPVDLDPEAVAEEVAAEAEREAPARPGHRRRTIRDTDAPETAPGRRSSRQHRAAGDGGRAAQEPGYL